MTGKLYFTIGIPRCGKSTYCNNWVNDQLNCLFIERPRTIVSSDDIRLALHGQRYEPLAETMVFAVKHVMIRAHLNRGFDVIVDGTHSTSISIRRLLEIDHTATAIMFDTTMEECLRRAKETGHIDLTNGPIQRIAANIAEINRIGLHTYMNKILEEINERHLYTKT